MKPCLVLLAVLTCAPSMRVMGQQWETLPLLIATEQNLGEADSRCVALGDLEGDGDLDAFVANEGSPSVLWINDGYGHFRPSRASLPGAGCGAIADLDGDGDVDLFLSGVSGRTFLNDGKGGFRSGGSEYGGPGGNGIAVADLNGDRHLDVAVSRFGFPAGLPTEIWVNDGSGGFLPGQAPTTRSVSMNVSLGDIDGDGDWDLVVANQADSLHNPVRDEVWVNQDSGRFGVQLQELGESCTYEVALGDLNGDGWLDAFAANSPHAGRSDPANRVFLNDTGGNLVDTGERLGASYSLSVALGDLDQDGDLDAFVGNLAAKDALWLNNGRGYFSLSETPLDLRNGMDVALGDLDGDGDLDAFVANNTWRDGDGANKVWLNQTRRNQ